MAKLFANSGDPDQTLHSDLDLHLLPETPLVVGYIAVIKYKRLCKIDNILINMAKLCFFYALMTQSPGSLCSVRI